MKLATTELGIALRHFANDIGDAFPTIELPREKAARTASSSTDPKPRAFNLSTPKMHLVGDFPWSAKYFGSLDNTDTSVGETEHKRAKQYYGRVGRHKHEGQIARQERRVRYLRSLREGPTAHIHTHEIAVPAWEEEKLPEMDLNVRYQMASGKRYFVDLSKFVHDNRREPAILEFIPKLKHYILQQLFAVEFFSARECDALTFESNRIYRHKVVRHNYTTYDLRRGQDSINPRTHPDIAVLAPLGSSHPFIYGRVVGVFHANIRFTSPRGSSLASIPFKRVDFLWVRWFEYDSSYDAGWQAKRLHRIKFVHADESHAFGFLHPTDIIRAMHLIGDFGSLGTDSGLPKDSVGRQFEALAWSGPRELEDDDWKFYFVNMFVESDIFMLFRGGGVGHQELHEYLQPFALDAGLDVLVLPEYDSDGQEVAVDEGDMKGSDSDSSEGSQDLDNDDTEIEDESDVELSDDEEAILSDNEWFENLGPEDGEDISDTE
ncbi:hypothetical protein EV360DRAFT_88268 [Lentinula raphanica]|nr:hypothetical protein EV360DRAFT_88268 [Lentinula raphanica]